MQKNKKILYIVNDLSQTNGWSTYAYNIIEEATKSGYDVHAAVEKTHPISILGVTQYQVLASPLRLLWNPIRILRGWIELRRVIYAIKPDVIHIIVEPYAQLFAIPSNISSMLVLTIHGTYATLPLSVRAGLRRRISTYFFRRALKKMDTVICVSNATKDKFLDFNKTCNQKGTLVIHNSVRIPNRETKETTPKDTNTYSIITIGAVKRRKGILDTIQIFSDWARLRQKKITYHVVGSLEEGSDYVRTARALAKELHSEYFSVEFHGQVEEMQKCTLLETASLYVHLERVSPEYTEVEGFGIGIIEAASYGLPALVAKGSATSEAVKDRVSGYVVDLNSNESIYDRIDQILIKHTISESDTQEWAKAHSPEIIFRKINEVYAISN